MILELATSLDAQLRSFKQQVGFVLAEFKQQTKQMLTDVVPAHDEK